VDSPVETVLMRELRKLVEPGVGFISILDRGNILGNWYPKHRRLLGRDKPE
jgi:hypothetical protein